MNLAGNGMYMSLSVIVLAMVFVQDNSNIRREGFDKVYSATKSIGVPYCKSVEGKAFDMESIRYISNEVIKTKIEGTSYFLEIDGDVLRDSTDSSFQEYGYIGINSVIQSDVKLDIKATFVELGHEDYIYWQETFLNRSYRLGLIKFDGEHFVEVCAGSGGTTTRH